ncbi:hypothetical protein F0D91_21010 [Escherichia coli]|nr:hypothetical protein [Escherichia coli]
MPIYLLPLLVCKDFENLTFCEGVNLWLQKRQRQYHFLTMKQQINLVSFSPCFYQEDYVERVSCKPVLDYPCHVRHACVVVRFFWVKGVRKWRQESPALAGLRLLRRY